MPQNFVLVFSLERYRRQFLRLHLMVDRRLSKNLPVADFLIKDRINDETIFCVTVAWLTA